MNWYILFIVPYIRNLLLYFSNYVTGNYIVTRFKLNNYYVRVNKIVTNLKINYLNCKYFYSLKLLH